MCIFYTPSLPGVYLYNTFITVYIYYMPTINGKTAQFENFISLLQIRFKSNGDCFSLSTNDKKQESLTGIKKSL